MGSQTRNDEEIIPYCQIADNILEGRSNSDLKPPCVLKITYTMDSCCWSKNRCSGQLLEAVVDAIVIPHAESGRSNLMINNGLKSLNALSGSLYS